MGVITVGRQKGKVGYATDIEQYPVFACRLLPNNTSPYKEASGAALHPPGRYMLLPEIADGQYPGFDQLDHGRYRRFAALRLDSRVVCANSLFSGA